MIATGSSVSTFSVAAHLPTVARELGCGKTTVRDALRRQGLEKRRRGRVRRDDISSDHVAVLSTASASLMAASREAIRAFRSTRSLAS
jgi:hypothetical protein